MSHFSSKTLRSLAKKGISIVGQTWIPGTDGTFANGETAYNVNDNDTHRVLTFAQVLTLATSQRQATGQKEFFAGHRFAVYQEGEDWVATDALVPDAQGFASVIATSATRESLLARMQSAIEAEVALWRE